MIGVSVIPKDYRIIYAYFSNRIYVGGISTMETIKRFIDYEGMSEVEFREGNFGIAVMINDEGDVSFDYDQSFMELKCGNNLQCMMKMRLNTYLSD